MNTLRNLFGLNQPQHKLKFNKLSKQWEVFYERKLLYIGTKEGCLVYIKNTGI